MTDHPPAEPLTPEEEAEVRRRDADVPDRERLREALDALRGWTGPSIPTDLAVLIVNVERAADEALAAAPVDRDGLREAYVAALVTAWEQAHYVSALPGATNATAIVSNIETRFAPLIPDWRDAAAEAARRAPLSAPELKEKP